MSHVTHPKLQLAGQLRAHRLIALVALFALVATAAVVLMLAIGDSSPTSSTANPPQAAERVDGGPEESGVAAAIGSQPTVAAPDESKIAAALGSGGESAPVATRPEESAVAAAISRP
jgi:hypothetical protein